MRSVTISFFFPERAKICVFLFFLQFAGESSNELESPKALSHTNSAIASDLKVNKLPACYGENSIPESILALGADT